MFGFPPLPDLVHRAGALCYVAHVHLLLGVVSNVDTLLVTYRDIFKRKKSLPRFSRNTARFYALFHRGGF